MGSVLLSDTREDTFKDEKMLFSILSASLLASAAGSALPEERISCSFPPGMCMAWSWSSVSGCKCTKEVNIAPVDLDKFRQDSLTAHNAYRAKHGVPALKLNDELNDVAQEWADYLMAVDGFEHRHPNKYGENVAIIFSGNNVNRTFWFSGLYPHDDNKINCMMMENYHYDAESWVDRDCDLLYSVICQKPADTEPEFVIY